MARKSLEEIFGAAPSTNGPTLPPTSSPSVLPTQNRKSLEEIFGGQPVAQGSQTASTQIAGATLPPKRKSLEEIFGLQKTTTLPEATPLQKAANPFAPGNVDTSTGQSVTDQGFLGDVKKAAKETGEKIVTTVNKSSGVGNASLGETLRSGLRVSGAIGKGLGDIVGSALERSGVSAAISGEVKNMRDALNLVSPKLLDNKATEGLGILASGATDAFNKWAEANPEKAQDVKDVYDTIQGVGIVAGGVQAIKKLPSAVSRVAEKVSPSLDRLALAEIRPKVLINKQSAKELEKLVEDARPVLSKKEQIAARRAGKELPQSLLKEPKILPDTRDIERGKLLQELGVDPKASINKKIEVIDSHIDDEATSLIKEVKQNDGIFNESQLRTHLDTVEIPPTLVGDAEATFLKVRNKFLEFVNKQPKKLSGLLQARKDFDAWIKTQIPDLYSNEKYTAIRQAVKDMRNAGNDYIEIRLPEGSTFGSKLRRQNLLFEAAENLAERGQALSGKSKIKQFGLRHPFIKEAIKNTAYAGGLGAAAKAVLD